jgi:PAS domain S-box-containing protein
MALVIVAIVVGAAQVAQLGYLLVVHDGSLRGAVFIVSLCATMGLASWVGFSRLTGTHRQVVEVLRDLNGSRLELQAQLKELRETQEKLARSEERFALAVEGTNEGIFIWNIRANETYFSPRCLAQLGFDPSDPPPTRDSWAARLHPDDRDAVFEAVQSHLDHRTPFDITYRIRTSRDTYRWIRARGQATWDSTGQPIQMVGSAVDCTDQKLTAKTLEESECRLRIALDNACVGFWEWDIADGQIAWDGYAARIVGYEPEEMPRTMTELEKLLYPDDLREMRKSVVLHFKDPDSRHDAEFRARHKVGHWVWINSSGRAIEWDSQGRAVRMMGTFQDVTTRRRITDHLLHHNRELEHLLHYVVAHDLREPLRGILGFSRLLMERHSDKLDQVALDYLSRIKVGAHRLDRLLEAVSTIGRMGRIDLAREEVPAENLLQKAFALLEQRIQETGASITVDPDLPILHVDPTLVTQAFYNLILNALKFVVPGTAPSIEITSWEGDTEIGIAVSDRGPGVKREFAERIFLLFQRAVGREVDGTGAGLAIVKQVAERHGGRAWVEEREGGGSMFVVTFHRHAAVASVMTHA